MKYSVVRSAMVVVSLCIYFSAVAQSTWVAPAAANDLKNPLKGDAASLELGKQLFSTICFVCHGNEGKGDGINAPSLARKPANLTSRRVQKQSDGAIFWKISEGNPPMLTFKETLSEEQRWALVNYVRKLGGNAPKEKAVAVKNEVTRPKNKHKKTIDKISAKPEKTASSKTTETAATAPVLFNPYEGINDGKVLFKNICGACHTLGKGQLVGPDLKGVNNRHDKEWLFKWIRSSQSMVKAGDPEAVRLFEENNQKIMNDHQYLSDLQITNILDYIQSESNAKSLAQRNTRTRQTSAKSVVTQVAKESAYSKMLTAFLYFGFAFVLFALLYVSLVLSKMVREDYKS